MAWLCATTLLWLRCSSVRLHASNLLIKCREKPDVKHSAPTLDRTSVRAPLPRSQSASICLSYFTLGVCAVSWKSVSMLSLTLDYCCSSTDSAGVFLHFANDCPKYGFKPLKGKVHPNMKIQSLSTRPTGQLKVR